MPSQRAQAVRGTAANSGSQLSANRQVFETGCTIVANRRIDVPFQSPGIKRAATDVAASSCMVGSTCE